MGDIDREGVEKAYGRWAPVYDLVFGKVFDAVIAPFLLALPHSLN